MVLTIQELLEPINEGEYELKNYLRQNGFKVKDVSDNPVYWAKDIDLIIEIDGAPTKIEVKWDYRLAETTNLFVELYNPRSKGCKGWFNFCQADYLAYGDAINQVFYFIKLDDLRHFIDREKKSLRCASTYDRSYGYLVPLEKIISMARIAKI